MAITAEMVKELRTATGAGVLEAKKALEQTGGDFDKAVDILREKGAARAAKRADRTAKEGIVELYAHPGNRVGVILELNCETDFVARNEGYISIARKMAQIALDAFPATLEELLELPYENGVSIREKVGEQNGVIGEKIELGRYERLEGACVVTYNHSNNKRSVVLALNKGGFEEAGRNLAMQVAALNPVAVGRADVDPKIVEKEIEIGKELARNEGKPEAMLEKIALGRLNKFFEDNTLLGQKYVKNQEQTVEQYLKSLDKELTVTGFKLVAL